MGIPFFPYNNSDRPKNNHSEKEVSGNEPKKARVESHGGGGGSHQPREERTQCSTCGKYHRGTCNALTRSESSSSSSSSSQGAPTPGKFDRYKGSKDKKRKSQSITNDENDLLLLQRKYH